MFTVPIFIGYGLVKGLSVGYYPWLLFLFLFISALPVIISALLSIPCMFVYQFIKKHSVIEYLIYTVIVAGLIVLAYYLISLIPENINFVESWGTTFWQIQDFLTGFSKTFAIFSAFTELIIGKTVGIKVAVFSVKSIYGLLILIAVTAALIALCFLLAKPLFYKMASTPFEFTKKTNIKSQENKVKGGFLSALYKEALIGFRSNSFIKLAGVLVVIMPLAILLLNKLYSAMNTRFIGMQMTVSFNALIMILILLSTNIDVASVFSRDGSSAYLNKVQPTPYGQLLFSKLLPNAVIGLVGVVVTIIIYAPYSPLTITDFIFFAVSIFSVFICHLFWSAELDVMNPQYSQYATFNEQANNPNENMSGIIMLILAVLTFVLTLLLSSSEPTGVWVKAGIITLVLAVFKVVTFFLKVKVYYKEK